MDALTGEWIRWAVMAVGGIFMALWKYEQNKSDKEVDDIKRDIQALKDTRLHKDDFIIFKTELTAMFQEIKQDIRDLRNHA